MKSILKLQLTRNVKEDLHRFQTVFRNKIKDRWEGIYSLGKSEEIRAFQKMVQKGGGRLRPFLFYIGTGGVARERDTAFWDVACGLESVHAAMLVHDDVIDNSLERRGSESMLGRFGMPRSLVTGDIGLVAGINLITGADMGKRRKKKMVAYYLGVLARTGKGVLEEIRAAERKRLSARELYRIYTYKTALYSVASPLVMGAMMRGKTKWQRPFARLGEKIGVLYQLRDDIVDQQSGEITLLSKIDRDPYELQTQLIEDIKKEIALVPLPSIITHTLAGVVELLYERHS